ncbi:hypothetical protein [Microbacterium sp.]|uniref:hypothetical protein n=1 Tax=Microbacterium sp. TaxID=51671 RepID=UPI002FE09ED3
MDARRELSALAATGALLLILTGCAPSAVDAILTSGEPAGPPAGMTADQLDMVDPDTIRSLGESSGGAQFFVAASSDPAVPICIYANRGEFQNTMACGSLPLRMGAGAVSAELSTAEGEASRGERVGEFLRVFE